jgi:hypothetical protein
VQSNRASGKDFRWRWETKMKWDSVVKRRKPQCEEAQACSNRAAKASGVQNSRKSTEEKRRDKNRGGMHKLLLNCIETPFFG